MKRDTTYVGVPYKFLNECFSYSEDGYLYWKLRPLSHFSTVTAWKAWHTRCFGKPVGSLDKQGYYNVGLHYNGKVQRLHLHRILYCLHMKRDLQRTELVDHINRDRKDNRLQNLRLVDHARNARNTDLRKNNTSGKKYIYWCKAKEKWQVSALVSGKKVHVGFYQRLEDAVVAQEFFYKENL